MCILLIQGTFAPVKDTYSPDFRSLVRDLLQKDPIARPTAEEILFQRLPEVNNWIFDSVLFSFFFKVLKYWNVERLFSFSFLCRKEELGAMLSHSTKNKNYDFQSVSMQGPGSNLWSSSTVVRWQNYCLAFLSSSNYCLYSYTDLSTDFILGTVILTLADISTQVLLSI